MLFAYSLLLFSLRSLRLLRWRCSQRRDIHHRDAENAGTYKEIFRRPEMMKMRCTAVAVSLADSAR